MALETGFLEINKVKSGLDGLVRFHLGSELSSNSVYLGCMDRWMRLYAGLKSIKHRIYFCPALCLYSDVHMLLSDSF